MRLRNTILIMVFLAGCQPMDPEALLFQKVQASPQYTIYNYPTPYLTTKQQNIRQAKQAQTISSGQVRIGMMTAELADLWGRPNEIQRSQYPRDKVETFIYESRQFEQYYFVFVNGRLQSWHKG